MSDNKIQIIAEIASSHVGSVEKLKNLLSTIADYVCPDYIKLQVFNLDELIPPFLVENHPLQRIAFDLDQWLHIIEFANNLSIPIIYEPYDNSSLSLVLKASTTKKIKIPTSDICDEKLIRTAIATDRLDSIYFGSGGATLPELTYINNLTKDSSVSRFLVHGFQSYPTNISDVDLLRMKFLADHYNINSGYADHTDGEQYSQTLSLCFAAISLGATYIEKHFTSDRSLREDDYYSSFHVDEFQRFIKDLRSLSSAIVTPCLQSSLSENEKIYRLNMKKRLYSTTYIAEGDVVDERNSRFGRTASDSLSRLQFLSLSSKVAITNIAPNIPIVRNMFI